MTAPGRAMGVDLGARRVGLALTDPLRIISSPHTTLEIASEQSLVDSLRTMCAEYGVSLVVIGFPLSADGSEGPGCVRARRIARALGLSGIQAELQDERWSSRDAEDILRKTGKRRQTSKEKIDAIAASLILSDYLREGSHS